jgi:hypothetical protein
LRDLGHAPKPSAAARPAFCKAQVRKFGYSPAKTEEMLPTPVVKAFFSTKCSEFFLPGLTIPGKSQEIIVSAGDSVE